MKITTGKLVAIGSPADDSLVAEGSTSAYALDNYNYPGFGGSASKRSTTYLAITDFVWYDYIQPDLDVPIEVHLSDNIQGPQAEVGISITYFKNLSIAKDVGDAFIIDDEFGNDDPLYEFWITDKIVEGQRVTYRGETMLGRLGNTTLFVPPSFTLEGPVTGREAFLALLAHFRNNGARWLRWDEDAIPEFVIQTSQGVYLPQLAGVRFVQGNPLLGETTYSAQNWIYQLFELFGGDEFKLRISQPLNDNGGLLYVKAPWWAGNGYRFDLNKTYLIQQTTTLATYDILWNGSDATYDLTFHQVGINKPIAIRGTVLEGESRNANNDIYGVAIAHNDTYLRLSVIGAVDGNSFYVNGLITGVATGEPLVNPIPIYDDQISADDETVEIDLDWMFFSCEIRWQGFEFLPDQTDVFPPAYIEHEPEPFIPFGNDYVGTRFRGQGLPILDENDNQLIVRWLPAGPGDRQKIDTLWEPDVGAILEAGTPIALTIALDFYWSASNSAYGAGDDIAYSKHITPEAYGDTSYPPAVAVKAAASSTYIGPISALPAGDTGGDDITLPYTFPVIFLPQDGSEVKIRWKVPRTTGFIFNEEGIARGILVIWFEDGVVKMRKEAYYQHAAEAGPGMFTMVPYWEINASVTSLTENTTSGVAIWGEDDAHIASIPGLAAAREAYPDRPRKVINAGAFNLDPAIALSMAESFVRRHWAGAEVVTLKQLKKHPFRPDNLNDIYRDGPNLQVLIDRSYDETHRTGSSNSESIIRFRREQALRDLFISLPCDVWDVSGWDDLGCWEGGSYQITQPLPTPDPVDPDPVPSPTPTQSALPGLPDAVAGERIPPAYPASVVRTATPIDGPERAMHPSKGTTSKDNDMIAAWFNVYDADTLEFIDAFTTGTGAHNLQWNLDVNNRAWIVRSNDTLYSQVLGSTPQEVFTKSDVEDALSLSFSKVYWGGPGEGLIAGKARNKGKAMAIGYGVNGGNAHIFAANVTDGTIPTGKLVRPLVDGKPFDFISTMFDSKYGVFKARPEEDPSQVPWWFFEMDPDDGIVGIQHSKVNGQEYKVVSHASPCYREQNGILVSAWASLEGNQLHIWRPDTGERTFTQYIEGHWRYHIQGIDNAPWIVADGLTGGMTAVHTSKKLAIPLGYFKEGEYFGMSRYKAGENMYLVANIGGIVRKVTYG